VTDVQSKIRELVERMSHHHITRTSCCDKCELEALLPALNIRADTQRMWDLIRYKRQELHTDNLISNEEYAALAEDHVAVKRLENYDKLVAPLERRLENLKRIVKQEYWHWQGDGSDHLESLSCPIIITSVQMSTLEQAHNLSLDTVDKLQNQRDELQRKVAALEKQLEEERDGWRHLITTLISAAKSWWDVYDMYRTAWVREMGGTIVRKSHEIDGFVLRTREIYEGYKQVEGLKKRVTELEKREHKFIALCDEITEKPCSHERLNEDGYCRRCGATLRGTGR
jgi:hypothetical protein